VRLCFLAVSALVFLLDRLSKLWALKALSAKTITLIPELFDLRLAHNTGAAFSIFASSEGLIRKLLLLFVPLLIALFVLYYGLFRARDRITCLSLSFIFGGALGNLYDRFFFGKVVDFIDIHYKSYHYPTFNLADAFIFVGVILLAVRGLRES